MFSLVYCLFQDESCNQLVSDATLTEPELRVSDGHGFVGQCATTGRAMIVAGVYFNIFLLLFPTLR